jgi:PhnB protein
MLAQPYLNFDGRCEEAIEFYRSKLGAEVEMISRFKDAPEPPAAGMVAPGSENKIMHASFKIGESTIMASDCGSQGKPKFEGFSLSLIVKDVASANKLFSALSEGGQVKMPQAKTFFASSFGVVVDKFGVSWMVLAMP